jgi:hypothetical protein
MKKLKVDLEMVANTMEDVARVDMEYCLEKKPERLFFSRWKYPDTLKKRMRI